MSQVLSELEKSFDVIVIDSPPCLVTDTMVLGRKVDGVLMVVHPGHTHADAAVAALELFERIGANVVGVVLNRIPRDGGYHGYRQYNSYYNHYSPNALYTQSTNKLKAFMMKIRRNWPKLHAK